MSVNYQQLQCFKEKKVNSDFWDKILQDYGLDYCFYEDDDYSEDKFINKKAIDMLCFKIRQIMKKKFSKRDCGIFYKYYFESWNQQLIAKCYSLTQPAICKIIEKMTFVIRDELKKWDFLI